MHSPDRDWGVLYLTSMLCCRLYFRSPQWLVCSLITQVYLTDTYYWSGNKMTHVVVHSLFKMFCIADTSSSYFKYVFTFYACLQHCMAMSVCWRSVDSALWFRVKYLNKYWMDCHDTDMHYPFGTFMLPSGWVTCNLLTCHLVNHQSKNLSKTLVYEQVTAKLLPVNLSCASLVCAN